MDRAVAGAVPHFRDGAQGLTGSFRRHMHPTARKRVHAVLLVLLAAMFYGGFILAQWLRSGA